MSADRIAVVAGIVWDREGERILIAKRRGDDEHGGMWEFPGGKVKEGERPEEALVRELEEELGITVVVLKRLTTVEHRYPAYRIALHAFSCRHVAGEPAAIDCADWRWVSPGELARYRFSPPDQRIIPYIDQLERDLKGKPEAEYPPEGIGLDQ